MNSSIREMLFKHPLRLKPSILTWAIEMKQNIACCSQLITGLGKCLLDIITKEERFEIVKFDVRV